MFVKAVQPDSRTTRLADTRTDSSTSKIRARESELPRARTFPRESVELHICTCQSLEMSARPAEKTPITKAKLYAEMHKPREITLRRSLALRFEDAFDVTPIFIPFER